MLSVYNCACLQEMSRCDECIFLLLLLVVMGVLFLSSSLNLFSNETEKQNVSSAFCSTHTDYPGR